MLENHVENIRKVRSSDRAKVYQAHVEQLGFYSANLRHLESANQDGIAHFVLGNLCAEHERSLEEAEIEIAERNCCLDETRSSYQGLSDDLQKSEFNAKSAKVVITSAREAITRAQVLLKDNEQILALEKKRMEELEDNRGKVNLVLNAESSELETLCAKLAAEKLLTKEELRNKAMAEVEKTRQRDI